ncbi:MAG: hypothetical protein JKY20_11900 [Alphaproteobacteria bacterium]|nr:hypothetical protein [Alphaproteobacteria bacterium]
MALNIDTFSNEAGGYSFFKAVGHPLAAEKAAALLQGMTGKVAIYDPLGNANAVAELYDLSALDIVGVYVQDVEAIGDAILGHAAQPVAALPESGATVIFVINFDAARMIDHIRALAPDGATFTSLDALRLDDSMLTNKSRYLDPLNFATNFAFFRDTDTLHTTLFTANYWADYGASDTRIWCRLMGEDGATLAEWWNPAPRGSISIDSQDIRKRFDLAPFTGQLFVHVTNAAGHDVVKYALDTYGDDDTVLSCTHDANAWPADLYAGLPAPGPNEQVILWIQNSHPCPIPAAAIGLRRMGDDEFIPLMQDVPPFGGVALDVASLLPNLKWPAQIEIKAGKHFVRPRYEVITKDTESGAQRRRISHPNVERTDLAPDPAILSLSPSLGKGFLLPAPILPIDRFRTLALPTPMSTGQSDLPVAAILYDRDGAELARHNFGRLERGHAALLDVDSLLSESGPLKDGFGHLELVYDFTEGGGADGWLHGLFRYEDRRNGHGADTSFGAHIFNTVATFRNEPQSYNGPAPGLSTRLFLRVAAAPLDAMCHLIYCASAPWRDASDTQLELFDRHGESVSTKTIHIPCGGSLHWRYSEMFDPDERGRAGESAYVIIRDTSCRLFGYHGLCAGDASFSLDHMFGF